MDICMEYQNFQKKYIRFSTTRRSQSTGIISVILVLQKHFMLQAGFEPSNVTKWIISRSGFLVKVKKDRWWFSSLYINKFVTVENSKLEKTMYKRAFSDSVWLRHHIPKLIITKEQPTYILKSFRRWFIDAKEILWESLSEVWLVGKLIYCWELY